MDSALQKILDVSRGEKFDFDTSETWLDLFKRQVKTRPNQISVADDNSAMTYAELDAISDKIAAWLLKNGVREDEFVAIRMGRTKNFVAAVLGVQKIGAAYVPIDLDYPAERVSYMIYDSEARITVTDKLFAEISASNTPANEIFKTKPENLAYMIYTSGSTGKPKGVMIQHKALLNFVYFISRRWSLTEQSRIACHSNFAFDASVEDLFPALTVGGTVFIVPEEARRDVFEMRNFIARHKINGGGYSTRFGQLLTDANNPLDVNYICVGGEAMTSVPNVSGKIFNTYGPTEFTVDATYFELERGKTYNPIPIGRPIDNCAAFIVDKNNKLLPLGEIGELCLAGPQISAGYWKKPELTAEKFADIELFDGKTVKIYHTGDLARYNDDNQLEFCGRIDFQVKFRGFRIELGEIETRAAQFSGISEVAADVKSDFLVLYYTSTQKIDENALKNFLSATLADYMVPSLFIRLEKMPMTPNGKLDKKLLPEPDVKSTRKYVEPRTESEKIVVECMIQSLGGKIQVGATDNFFELGGDSIKAIRLVSLLRERGLFVKVNDVLRLKTVEKIASSCKTGGVTEINQNPFVGVVEDSAIFRFYKDLHLPDAKYFNQSTLLAWKGKINLPKLQNAFDKLTFQHDMLRATIVDGHLFVKSADTRIKIEEFALERDNREEIRALCEEIQSNLAIESALVRAAVIHAGKNRDLFFVTAHHTIIDGISWRILLADLETALNGENLPQKTNSYQDYALAMKKYRDSFALSREIPYWQAVERKMLALETSDGKNYARKFNLLNVSLEKSATERFLSAKLSIYALEVNDLLLAAVGRSYRKLFGKNSLSIQLEGHGREHIGAELLTDRTVGWFTSIYPVVLENLSGDSAADLLNVKENLRRVPNKGVGYNILAFVDGKNPLAFEKNRVPKVVFNYLGNVSGEKTHGKYFAPDIEDGFSSGLDYQSEKNCDGCDLAINCLVDDGKFSLWLGYNLEICDETLAKSFATEILSQIEQLTAHLDTAKPIVTASDLGETQWNAAEFQSVIEKFAERGEHLQRIYPLTPMQAGMLLEHVTNPKKPAYRLVDIYKLDFLPTESELRLAIDALAQKHEVFRTAIIHEGVSIYRQAITDRKISLTMVDLSDCDDKFAAAKKIREEFLTNGFDLQRKSLLQFVCAKISATSCYLIIAVHHIIIDGWCVDTYLSDFERFLLSARSGEKISVGETQNGAYETAVREILAKDVPAAVEYFRRLLDGYENKAEIPSYGVIPVAEQCPDSQVVVNFDAETLKKLEKVCRNVDATLANGLELVWSMVLQTVCRLDDVVFAKVVSGRDKFAADVSNLVGLFINSVPVRVKTDKNSTATEILKDLHRQSTASNEFDFCPLAEIQKSIGMSDGFIYSIVSVENYGDDAEKMSILKPEIVREEHLGSFDLDATIKSDGNAEIVFSFDPTRHKPAEISRIIALMKNYIAEIAEKPDAPLNSLPHMTLEDAENVISLSQGEKFDFDTSETWLDLFKRQVKTRPNQISVADDNSAMTYAELDAVSDKIAAWLLKNGVREDEFVAIRMGRTKNFVAAVLGVQKIGAAYVPIDLDYPAERISYMIADSEAKITVTDELFAEISASNTPANEIFKTKPENLAYMIYTSGSTGKPKGVVIQHKALLNFVHFISRRWSLTEQSRIACHSNFAFDASVEDLFPALTVGGTIFVVPEEARRDVLEMRNFIAQHKINGGCYSTRFGQLLTDENNPLDVNYIVLGGEAMTSVPNVSGKIFNTYGPTEFTVDATYFELERGKTYNPIPIGRPLYNCSTFIVDKNNRLLPRGMIGELCLAGAQISAGYWKRPELTAEKFSEIQVGDETVKVYHTGDLARYNDNNQLEFCGRIDFQVKLRGFRIELGEIENRAAKFPEIIHAIAEVKKNTLVLYYTSAKIIDEAALKDFLAQSLTDYMVPSIFVRLEAMPMTPSGKIDRKLLPTPNFSVRQSEYEPPANEIERKICSAFAKVLALDENSVGRNDDFYLLGGDSIKSMMVMLTAGVDDLSAKDIFKNKTARRISEAISAREHENIAEFELQARQKEIFATAAQIQMIDYQFLNVNSTMYNLSGFYRLNAKLDAEKLAAAVEKVAHHHPALSTLFEFDDEGNIVQKIHPEILPPVEIEEISAADVEKLSKTLLKPFDLFNKPLFRAKIFKCDETLYLFVDMHHTISDGTSQGVLLENISKAYRGETLGNDYFYSYLAKENAKLNSDEYATAKKYFQNLLEGRNWCTVPTPDYDSWEAECGEEDANSEISVEDMARAEKRSGFSRNVISITAAVLAMRDYCQKSFIRVDFLNSNRVEEYLQDTVGLLFKILPVAVNLDDYPSHEQLMREISRQVTESFANSICDYSSEDNIALRDALLVNYVSDLGDASFLKGFEPTEIPLTSENPASAGHVDIYLMEESANVNIAVEYQRKAYADGNIKRFLTLFVEHLKQLVGEN